MTIGLGGGIALEMNNTRIATIQCANDYVCVYPWIIRMDNNKSYIPKPNKNGYPAVSFRRRKLGITQKVEVHRIIGYQKFGDEIFKEGNLVRHLDNNKLNFDQKNIALGTPADNHNDNPESVNAIKTMACVAAARELRKFSDLDKKCILKDRSQGMTLKELGLKYGAAKSTLSYICRGITYKN